MKLRRSVVIQRDMWQRVETTTRVLIEIDDDITEIWRLKRELKMDKGKLNGNER